MKTIRTSHSPQDTQQIANELVTSTAGSLVLALHGDLGSGKTCFVQGIAKALHIDTIVTSPTFTIVNEYAGSRPLYHIDLYRLNHPDEILSLGFSDYLEPDGVTAVEWAERAGDLIPDSAIRIHFQTQTTAQERTLTIEVPETH